jgi:hypothetical protein
MPGRDRTGPMGEGPMTGRRAGYCGGYNIHEHVSPGHYYGAGFGRGRGYGRNPYPFTGMGWGRHYDYRAYNYTPSKTDEKQALKIQAEYLENELKQVKNRLDSLNED